MSFLCCCCFGARGKTYEESPEELTRVQIKHEEEKVARNEPEDRSDLIGEEFESEESRRVREAVPHNFFTLQETPTMQYYEH